MAGIPTLGPGTIIVAVIVLIILWIIISIPVYLAGKLVGGHNATIGRAMGATLVGPVVFGIVLVIAGFLFGSLGTIVALIIAFLAWLWVYKEMFRTGWLGALGIAVLSVIVTVIILAVLALIGIAALAL